MVRQKLKSRRGASALIALLVLFICVTAGMAALTAASANMGRYSHLQDDQQRYLAVSSAAKLVRDELCGKQFEASARVLKSNSYEEPEGVMNYGEFYTMNPGDQLMSPSYTGAFSPWLLEPLGQVFKLTDIPELWWAQTGAAPPTSLPEAITDLGITTNSGVALLDQVKWTLSLDEDYTITARFWLEDGGAEYYPIVLTVPASKTEALSDPQREGAGQRWRITKTVTVRWSDGADIQQG